jgi:hypothetical protein
MLISSGMSIFSIVTETLLAIIHDEHFNLKRWTEQSYQTHLQLHIIIVSSFQQKCKGYLITTAQHWRCDFCAVSRQEAKFISPNQT